MTTPPDKVEQVQRYRPGFTANLKTGRHDFDGMLTIPDGEFVRYEDFAALQAEVARLTEERDIYKAADESMQAAHSDALNRALAAEAALAEARRDAERLDFLMDECATVCTDGSGNYFLHYDWLPEGHTQGPNAPNKRAAIDAALHQRKENGHAD